MSLGRFFHYGSVDLAFLCIVITQLHSIQHFFFVRLKFRYLNAVRTRVKIQTNFLGKITEERRVYQYVTKCCSLFSLLF